ncbi:QacE family quaternary ammonium compound efflux SMR transporter [Bacillus lacus]|uniref:QacE family quaternary ammonium compound efflux SMR transporter n=1 Tax=Metabacillus lacus TaxID=1983721 RepID=A0A7X2IYW6_9BACI|nr:multidrug efflux SMR transporter [Metabacillus lacus]MRX72042.1 QacE family quaternary ammonium compound efflux SMR transporter [Metabacillus lacus]
MEWIYLILAGFFEIVGVAGINRLNQKRNLFSFLYMAGGFTVSFILLSIAMQDISMGTAYAVWTGIGTAGSALMGIFFFQESSNWKRLLFISMIICSTVGLKLIS